LIKHFFEPMYGFIQAQHAAQFEREENEKLRSEIVQLQEKLQEATAHAVVAAAVSAPVAAPVVAPAQAPMEEMKTALAQFESLRKEYESI
jgi:hypothetical protein